MAGASLLTLIDDIATLLDDVAALSKVAAKKTAGVLGDDLAVNAEQVSGVKADRELPVVWAVAKGSFKNKFILVPAALAISAFIPWLITPLLLMGACFLCFEGIEKVLHWLFPHKEEDKQAHDALVEAVSHEEVDMVAFEQKKIKGAIRTDFILSAEIVVIALGTVQEATIQMQALVVSTVALLITFGVYGLVAAIVKLDDAGLYLLEKGEKPSGSQLLKIVGKGLLSFAPKLMKTLTVVGTVAMFLVGGGIFTHGVPFLHHFTEESSAAFEHLPSMGYILGEVTPVFINMGVGLVVGLLVLAAVKGIQSVRKPQQGH
ncbi:DUF808 domain-containing protein [Litoribrevibacter albus]|uniref:Membrane protein n=1 Tax=Litoribrevibacter albus TaxID=1473156 RepID=A0AA37S938_9GAMM|nr:DUF808 domain-containing protein [Litoribrevibacter albus]GLQ30848.1 membrane protein [Litoribrevibacter albus]